jgi:hypothetical protein
MASEIPDVFFVFMVFMACGMKEAVVQVAAAKPRTVIIFISKDFAGVGPPDASAN